MKIFVMDCSVTMAWLFEDEANPYTERALEALSTYEAYVPSLWAWEVGNVLLVNERRKRITEAQSLQFTAALETLPIHIDEQADKSALKDTLHLARLHHLSNYDAAYLELAIRLRAALVTQDKLLLKIAKQCGIDTWRL